MYCNINGEMLTEQEACRVGIKFLLLKFPEARIKIEQVHLFKENSPFYILEGEITLPPRSLIARFVHPPIKYGFKVEVDAEMGKVKSYELR